MIKRELYLRKIRGFYDNELIKVITGIRRCGKSVLLRQIIEELKEKKVKENRIIYMNFEDLKYNNIRNEMDLYNYIMPKITKENKYYLFFDEIQNVENFEKAINSFRATNDVSIFITGSNSRLLSKELSTVLSGRYVSFKMLPFTFKEYIETIKEKGTFIDKDSAFSEYLNLGGMPAIFNFENYEEKKMYLDDIYSSVILRDIVDRYKIKDIDLINKLVQFMMENIGGILSANSIKNYLRNDNINVAPNTIYNYMEYINSSFLFNKVNRYDIRGKSVMATLEKYYVTDLGLLQLKKSSIEKKVGGRLENIVYNELISRGYEVYIGKTDKGEIDFVINSGDEIKYIQVADLLLNDEVYKREFGAFKGIDDNFPRYVLTMDKIDYSTRGIIHKNIIDFLLSDEL